MILLNVRPELREDAVFPEVGYHPTEPLKQLSESAVPRMGIPTPFVASLDLVTTRRQYVLDCHSPEYGDSK
jgi:hypothetical protein